MHGGVSIIFFNDTLSEHLNVYYKGYALITYPVLSRNSCVTYSVLITISIYTFIPLPEDFKLTYKLTHRMCLLTMTHWYVNWLCCLCSSVSECLTLEYTFGIRH